MLWARMARAFRAVVARERAWSPMSTGRQLPRKQLREILTGACSGYAIGDHEVPHAGWMVGYSVVIRMGRSRVRSLFPESRLRDGCFSVPNPGDIRSRPSSDTARGIL